MKYEPLTIDRSVLIETLERQYALTGARLDFVPLGEVACSYIVHTQHGERYFLKLYTDTRAGRLFSGRLDFYLPLCQRLKNEGIVERLPCAVATVQGNLKTQLDSGDTLVLFDFINGPNVGCDTPMPDALFAQLGALFGRLHARGGACVNEGGRAETYEVPFAAGLGRVDLMQGFFAADGSLTPAANSLYQSKADTVLTEQQVLDNAINFAAYGGSTEAVAFLVEKGANPSGYAGHWWPWDWGSTPLHKAVDSQDVEMIRFLVEKGADPTVKDLRWKESAPQWATYYDDGKEVLKLLNELEAAYIKEHPPEAETVERLPEDAH